MKQQCKQIKCGLFLKFSSIAVWSNYFWPTGYFTKTRQLAGNVQ